MQDELSALARTGYSHFSSLISDGVVIDFHPALVQVFLNYWTALFGKSPWVVKLPSMILGIATVYMFYRVAAKYMGSGVALMGGTRWC